MHISFPKAAALLATSLLAATSLAKLTTDQIVDRVEEMTKKTDLLRAEAQKVTLINAPFQGIVRI